MQQSCVNPAVWTLFPSLDQLEFLFLCWSDNIFNTCFLVVFFTKQEDTLAEAEADTNISININIAHPQSDAETLGSRRMRGAVIQRASLKRGWEEQGGGWWDPVCCAIKDNHTLIFSKAYPSAFSYRPWSSPTCTHHLGWCDSENIYSDVLSHKLMARKSMQIYFSSTWIRDLTLSNFSVVEKIIWWDFAIPPFSEFC